MIGKHGNYPLYPFVPKHTYILHDFNLATKSQPLTRYI